MESQKNQEPILDQENDEEMNSSTPQNQESVRKSSIETLRKEQDAKSVFVQSVDYASTVQELEAIFEDCGTIVRVTILKQKATNTPKGCAYVEFTDVQSVNHAIMLSGTKLRTRSIKVTHKRTNIRGMGNQRGSKKQQMLSKFLNRLARGR